MPLPQPQFIGAANFTPASRTVVDLVVLHSMESAEGKGTARNVARWFAGEAGTPPKSSAHYCVDAEEVIRCVVEADIAWHAPGANANGIGIEHAGRASQSAADWADVYSATMLSRSAELTADICRRWFIPPVFVDAVSLARGAGEARFRARGITTHAQVSIAFRRSTHTDPGPGFPIAWYCERVRALVKEA